MFTRSKYIDEIVDRLSWIAVKVKRLSSLNLLNDNIHSETFFCGLLNIILDCNLKNLNNVTSDYTAIDLGDEQEKLAVQVTSNSDSEKIHNTIKKFLDQGQEQKYSRLIILIIGEKKRYRTTFDTKGKFSFSKDNDILDMQWLVNEIHKKDSAQLEKIYDYLAREITPLHGYGGNGRIRIAREMLETAHNLCLQKLLASDVEKTIADQIIEEDIEGAKYEEILTAENSGKCYLVGEFGTGKSHALLILTQRLARQYLLDPTGILPLFGRARDINEKGSIRQWLDQFFLEDNKKSIVLIDGLDEVDYSSTRELMDEIRLLQSQNIKILASSRTIFGLANVNEVVNISPLTELERIKLYKLITDDPVADRTFQRLDKHMNQMLFKPFFCIMFAQLKKSPKGWARTEMDLVSTFVESSLKKCGEEMEDASDDLANMAAAAVDRDLGDILVSDVRLKGRLSTALKTGFISQSENQINFPLPIIAQWLAAEAIRRGMVYIEDILLDKQRVDRWMYALSILFSQMTFEESSEYFSKIVATMPGAALRIIHDGVRFGELIDFPTAMDCGLKIQYCMQVWVDALGPLSRFIAPYGENGLYSLAIEIKDGMIIFAWLDEYREKSVLLMPFDEMRQVCRHIQSRHIYAQPTWPWVLVFEVLLDNLEKVIKNHALYKSNAQLEKEWLWKTAISLKGNGDLYEGRFQVESFEQYRKLGSRTVIANGMQISTDEFFAILDKYKAQGITEFSPPYPIADKKDGYGYIWSNYSVGRYLERTRFVFHEALNVYMDMLETVFSALKDDLRIAQLFPCKLVGGLEFNEKAETENMPIVTWYWEALPKNEKSQIDIQVRKIPFGSDKLFYALRDRNTHLRPELHNQQSVEITSGYLRCILSATPVTDMVYQWLEKELRAIGWFKLS